MHFPCSNWIHLLIITPQSHKTKYHQPNMSNTNNLLTLFTWLRLLSSTGSTAAALTLNTTPMRAANTTRSCMLWRECRWPTRATVTGAGGSQRQCGCVCLCVCVWAGESEQLRLAGDPEKNGGGEKKWSAVGGSCSEDLMFLQLYL